MNFGGIRFIISRSSHSAQEIRPFITEEERDGNTLALPKLPNGSPERANKINAKIICFGNVAMNFICFYFALYFY